MPPADISVDRPTTRASEKNGAFHAAACSGLATIRAGGTFIRTLALGASSRCASRVRRRLARASLASNSSIAAAAATCGRSAGGVRALRACVTSFLSTVLGPGSDVVGDIIRWILVLAASDEFAIDSSGVTGEACVEPAKQAARKFCSRSCPTTEQFRCRCMRQWRCTEQRSARCDKMSKAAGAVCVVDVWPSVIGRLCRCVPRALELRGHYDQRGFFQSNLICQQYSRLRSLKSHSIPMASFENLPNRFSRSKC